MLYHTTTTAKKHTRKRILHQFANRFSIYRLKKVTIWTRVCDVRSLSLSLSLSLSSLHWTRQSKLCSQITCHKLSMKAQHTQFSHTRCIWKQNSVACCPRPNGDDPVAFIHPYFDQAPVTTLLNVANQRTIYTSFDEMV